MQTRKASAWKIGKRLLIAVLAGYFSLAVLVTYVFPTRYSDCERDTKELNGGERIYAGRKFKIVLCGTGGDENFMSDKIRMQIFSESGDLLAQRKFYVDWDGAGPFELEYGDGHLTYFNDSKNSTFENKVSMPPTRLDWIRARVPLID
jgi:hypothetical protein